MSQFGDGGLLGSKPYVSSGAYIHRMSDYCGHCRYRVNERVGEDACPFNALYWDFLARHREKLGTNPRLALRYRNWDRQSEGDKTGTRAQAAAFLAKLDAGSRAETILPRDLSAGRTNKRSFGFIVGTIPQKLT